MPVAEPLLLASAGGERRRESVQREGLARLPFSSNAQHASAEILMQVAARTDIFRRRAPGANLHERSSSSPGP